MPAGSGAEQRPSAPQLLGHDPADANRHSVHWQENPGVSPRSSQASRYSNAAAAYWKDGLATT
eukprot:4570539-Lingulodinium_polyedra.AAC.1